MKRVLIFSLNYYPRFIGGAEVAIKEITNRITPADVEFHMVTLRIDLALPRVERIGNVLVHRIGFATKAPTIADLGKFPLHLNKYFFQIGAYLKARELHKKYHYDSIWAMMAHSCAIPAGMFKHAFPNVAYLLTLQEGDPPEAIENLMKPVWGLFKQGFTRADGLQPISTFLQRWGQSMGFKGDSRVIPNAVDIEQFSQDYSPEEVQSMCEKLGKKKDEVFLVTTSRLVHKNGIDDVVRALALLPENISFLIYGIGPDEAKLRTLAKGLKVEKRARFMGEISHKEMPLMMKACDIFIRPSRSEGMGNSFVEAMALRKPVIATQEGGIGDFLFDAKRNPDKPTTGWAVDKNSPEQIARVVQEIVADPGKVKIVTETASAMVIKKYDWNMVAEAMQRLFNALFDELPKIR